MLRKKTSQVSTLHVIHHGCMPMSVWFGVKFTPGSFFFRYFWMLIYTYFFIFSWNTGGHSTFFGLLNTFVHIIMYTYYLFSALGPQLQKVLWWKKYLTALQMVSQKIFWCHPKLSIKFEKSQWLNFSFHFLIVDSICRDHGSCFPIVIH